jgi:hypothetical protein
MTVRKRYLRGIIARRLAVTTLIALAIPSAVAQQSMDATSHASHAAPAPTARPAEKPGGLTRVLRRFSYLAAVNEPMVFQAPTTVRYEPRPFGGVHFAERRFAAGERAICNEATFNAVGIGGGGWDYVCTRLVETVNVRELMPQATGLPYVDPRLEMLPRKGYARAVFGPSLGPHKERPGPGGEFRISCAISHMGFEDPMVWPGRRFWHHHTFAGNPNIDRSTTDPRAYPDSLCAGGNINRSGYWFPSVIDTRFGMPVVPAGVAVYYKGQPDTLPAPDLRFIAGDPMRQTPRDPSVLPVSRWTCYIPNGPVLTQGLGDEIPVKCPVGARIIWAITFPNCWNGKQVDSPDHKSHMATAGVAPPRAPNACPWSHPQRIFDISLNVHFTVDAADDPSRWRLSSDAYDWTKPAGYSAHADWWNGWDEAFLAAIKAECHDKNRECGQDNAPDTRRINF